MKKYAKILSILLCLSMLVGMIAMVATAEETTEPVVRDPSEVKLGGLPVPQAGYYVGETFTSEAYQHNETYTDITRLTDGKYDGNGGNWWRSYQFDPANLKQNPGGTQIPAFLFDVSAEPVTLNGLQIWSWTGGYWMKDLRVEVKTSPDGEWENVGTYENVIDADNGYWLGGDVFQYYFNKTVTAYALRILVDTIEKGDDAEGYTRWVLQMYEIAPMIVEVTEPEQPDPSEPEATEPVVRDPSVATDGVLPAPQAGYYDGEGNFVSALYQHKDVYKDPALLVDGNKTYGQWRSYQFEYAELKQHGGTQVPAIVFDLSAEPVTLNGLNLWCYTYATWMIDFRVQVKTSADGDWETVGTYTDVNNTDNGYWLGGDEYLYYFDKTVTAYAMQILVDEFDKVEGDRWVYQLYEIVPMIVEVTEPEQPDPSEPEATEPEATEPRDPSKLGYATLPVPEFGYYDANGVMHSGYSAPYTLEGIVDGSMASLGCTDYLAAGQIVQNGGTDTAAIVFDMGRNPMTLNGLEYVTNWENNCAVDVTIQVVTSVGGEWVTVYEQSGISFNECDTISFLFDTVTAYKLRILFNEFLYTDDGNVRIAIQEITPYVVYEGAAEYVVNAMAATKGFYDDGEVRENLVSGTNATGVIDGSKNGGMESIGTEDNSWIFEEGQFTGHGGAITPVFMLHLEGPTVITRLEIYNARNDNEYTPSNLIVEVLNENGEWVQVAEYENPLWEGPASIEFPAVETDNVRVLATVIPRVNGEAAHWQANEFVLYCTEGAVPGEDSEDPTDPTDPSDPSEPETTEPSEPDTSITADKVETLNNGDQIVIFYEDGKTVIGSSYADANNKKLGAIDATFSDEKLVISEDMMILTVSIDADGYITFVTENGKYLTSGATGNSLTLTDEATAYSLWVLEETDGGFLVKNVNAAYNNNPQYLEFFNGGFTTYGNATASSMAPYTFNFYLVYASDVQDPTEPSEPEATEPEATEPEATEPEATEPEATEPEATEPEATEPEATEPDNDPSGKTGDITLSVLVGLLAISAIGCGIVISKKKEF